ncbi:DUF502 domain-containing protein [Nevskia ramosa]|uniref:DUF502 domain-containing protein n=1 Tax=Nevskia ramosa TaxID=64002 RepID=UPI0004299C9B|nr:DUF502 domain-containing protein [Nevskia ramosa]
MSDLGEPLPEASPPPEPAPRLLRVVLRQWFFAGLLIWVPLAATLLVIRFLIGLLDTSLLLIPPSLRPDFPGLGVFLSVGLVFGTGALAANYLGGRLLHWAEEMLFRIPLVRTLYGGVKKLAETLFSRESTAFKRVVLIEWPRAGLWTIGFQAGDPLKVVREATGQDLIPVFVPTTPNPTGGFIMQVPAAELKFLDVTVEEGMRYIISLGVVAPGTTPAVTQSGLPVSPR